MSDGDLTISRTLTELLDRHAEVYFIRYHAPIPCRVESYDADKGLADVQPLLILPVDSEGATEAEILRGCPVAFPGGQLNAYTWPLFADDPVLAVPQDFDFSAYYASGTVRRLAGSQRHFSLSDCIILPSAPRSQSSPLPAAARASDGGVLYGLHYAGSSDADDFAAMAQKVLDELEKVETAFNGHVHDAGGYNVGGSPVTGTSGAGPNYNSASVACTKLKVE